MVLDPKKKTNKQLAAELGLLYEGKVLDIAKEGEGDSRLRVSFGIYNTPAKFTCKPSVWSIHLLGAVL